MRSKSILILTNRVPYPLKDGGNLAMHAMIEGYHNAGWEVHLLSMNTSRHYITPEQLKNVYTNISSFETVDVNNDIRVIETLSNFLFSKKPNHAERFYSANFLHRIQNAIERFDPSVVQIESIYLSIYLPELRQICNSLVILRMHNIESQVWERLASEAGNPFKRFYLNNLSQRVKHFEFDAWNSYDLLLPITQTDANTVKGSDVQTNMLVTPFGLEISPKEPNYDGEKWIGYHLGAMDWLPNVQAMKWFIKDVWPKIHSAVPEFEFHFAGRNMPKEFKANNPRGVVCDGEIANAESFISDKKILMVPLKSGGGIRVKILEAMAAGKIVISTDIGMQGIEAKPFKHYLAANTPNEFAQAVLWCREHRQEAEQIAESGSLLVRKIYNNSSIMDDLTARVNTLLQLPR